MTIFSMFANLDGIKGTPSGGYRQGAASFSEKNTSLFRVCDVFSKLDFFRDQRAPVLIIFGSPGITDFSRSLPE